MNYEPPCIYSMPEAFAARVQAQGVDVAENILADQAIRAATSNDSVSAAHFTTQRDKARNAPRGGHVSARARITFRVLRPVITS